MCFSTQTRNYQLPPQPPQPQPPLKPPPQLPNQPHHDQDHSEAGGATHQDVAIVSMAVLKPATLLA